MENNKFKTPLLQSAAVVAGIVFLILLLGSGSDGGGAGSFFSNIGHLILFAIGLPIGLAISIAILIGIFLAAVAMVDKAEAARMFDGLKKNFAAILEELRCAFDATKATGVTEEEYVAMKEELVQLQGENSQLHQQLNSVVAGNSELQNSVTSLSGDNADLKSKIQELTTTVEGLQQSETKINELVAELSVKLENSNDQELKDQMNSLEQLQTSTKAEIEAIGTRLAEVEAKIAKPGPAKRTTAAKKTTTARKTTARKSTAAKKPATRAKK